MNFSILKNDNRQVIIINVVFNYYLSKVFYTKFNLLGFFEENLINNDFRVFVMGRRDCFLFVVIFI